MTLKTRIVKAEKARPVSPPIYKVWYVDSETGIHTRHDAGGQLIETLAPSEWESRTKGEKVYSLRWPEEMTNVS